MASGLIADFKEYPATMALCSLWVLVFAMTAFVALKDGQVASTTDLFVSLNEGHRFGDMTLDEFRHGEVWRALTSTFVHFGIAPSGHEPLRDVSAGMHGRVVVRLGAVPGGLRPDRGGRQPAVGPRPPLAGLGPPRAFGGGSTVVLGLVALCAVVGWRSRTRIGDYLRAQMIGVLIFTAVLGQLVSDHRQLGTRGGGPRGGDRRLRASHPDPDRPSPGLVCRGGARRGPPRRVRDGPMARRPRGGRGHEAMGGGHRGRACALGVVDHFYRNLAVPRSEFVHKPFIPLAVPERHPQADAVPTAAHALVHRLSDEDFDAALNQSLALLDSTKSSLGTAPPPRISDGCGPSWRAS